jgi:hypothetical protein
MEYTQSAIELVVFACPPFHATRSRWHAVGDGIRSCSIRALLRDCAPSAVVMKPRLRDKNITARCELLRSASHASCQSERVACSV